jgi:tetratricopeptide (TPR) repeat protein
MKKLTLLLSIIFFPLIAFAALQSDSLLLFNQANDYYSKGQYDKAIAAYESLAGQKEVNASLHYNLGNAYFKIQKYGKAIACYERAAKLTPRDQDLRYNLNFVRAIVKEPGEPFPEILLTSINNVISLNELTVLSSVFFILLICGLIAYMLFKQRKAVIFNLACLLAVIILSGWLYIKLNREVFTTQAVVISGPAEVRNGPGQENSVGFSLPEGRKVTVLGTKDNWAAIGLNSEGLKGWIEKKYLEEI